MIKKENNEELEARLLRGIECRDKQLKEIAKMLAELNQQYNDVIF